MRTIRTNCHFCIFNTRYGQSLHSLQQHYDWSAWTSVAARPWSLLNCSHQRIASVWNAVSGPLWGHFFQIYIYLIHIYKFVSFWIDIGSYIQQLYSKWHFLLVLFSCACMQEWNLLPSEFIDLGTWIRLIGNIAFFIHSLGYECGNRSWNWHWPVFVRRDSSWFTWIRLPNCKF